MPPSIVKTQNSNTPTVATSTTVLAANSARIGWQIQNQDTTILYVYLGSGASASQYHFVLKACTGVHDGLGGSFSQGNGVVYTGVVSCFSTGTPSYTVLEQAP